MQGLAFESTSVSVLKSQIPSVVTDTFTKYAAELRRISLSIHEFNELAFQEVKSSAIIADFIQKEGFTVEREIAGDKTAFVGTFTQGNGGPVISFNSVFPHVQSRVTVLICRNSMHYPGLDMHVDIT
jgi:hypothetical protein